MSDFIDNVSDHRPIAMRLSLSKRDRPAIREIGDIDAIIDKLLASEKPKDVRKRAARRQSA